MTFAGISFLNVGNKIGSVNNSQKIKWWKKISGLKKTLLITACTILLFAILIIVFISPITKYLVEKYDERYTGRQITMDWAYVNPFTGYIHFNNFKINESKSDSVFFTSAGRFSKRNRKILEGLKRSFWDVCRLLTVAIFLRRSKLSSSSFNF